MKCRDILKRLYTLAPRELAEEWDNVGLLTGRPEKEVRRIYVALDATDEVIERALDRKADLLITHHPMIFHPMKTITGDDFTGRRIMELIRHDICYIAMHTNYDIACMADLAAEKLGLRDTMPLCTVHTDEDGNESGLGKVGFLLRAMSLSEFAEHVRTQFKIPHVKVYGDLDSAVEMIAILPGSGGNEVKYAINKDVDVYVTGDVSYHQGLDAVLQGLFVIDAGHYGIEKIFISHIWSWLKGQLQDTEVYVDEVREPFVTMGRSM